MGYTTLGRSGLRVSRLCLGTLNFGFKTSASDSHTIMDRAHHHGINFFDTSDVYGFQEGKEYSESVIGNWFAQGGGRRERTVTPPKSFSHRVTGLTTAVSRPYTSVGPATHH